MCVNVRQCVCVCACACVCVCVCACVRVRAVSVGMEGPMSHRTQLGPPSAARFHRRRTSGARDERYRSGTRPDPTPPSAWGGGLYLYHLSVLSISSSADKQAQGVRRK